MRIGYCRVSKESQNLASQVEALKRMGCDRIVKEKISGKSEVRAVLEKAVAPLKEGDTLIVWRIDRLGRSFFPLVELEDRMHRRGVAIISATESLDTTTRAGRIAYWFRAIFADMEHDGIISRTVAGLANARSIGKSFGRRPKLSPSRMRKAMTQVERGDPVADVAARFGICKATLYRHRKRSPYR
jgi:DNA invertase Pin-like site-specific DNA recombinase